MYWKFIFFFFIIIYLDKADSEDCTYQYKYSCLENDEHLTKLNTTQPLNCSVDNILDDAEYTLLLSEEDLKPTGVLRVTLFLPNVDCQYKIALLVNETIKTDDECKQHVFDNYNEHEIHSLDQTICISEFDNSTIIENNAICKENNIFIYFKHVFTGCYALHYKVNHNYVISSRQYISTSYQRREVEEPTFRCNYDNRMIDNQSRDLVTFTFGISVLPGSTSMSLELTPLSSEDENKEDACVEYSKAPQYVWNISLSGSSAQHESPKSCKVEMINNDNSTSTEDVQCSFSLPVSYDESYCFLITLHDSRCLRDTTWNPPPKNELVIPCAWIPKCTKVNKRSGIEQVGKIEDSTVVTVDLSSYIPITAGIILLIVIIGISFLYFYRSRSRIVREDLSLNATLRTLKEPDNIELDAIDTDEEHLRAIVLLYARGSKPFMSFMLHFREILECYCGCHVYDWYAACEWDAVARIGACEWADSLIKNNNRVVWIDTPTARSLVNMKNSQNMINKSPSDEQLNTDLINDFRDLAFPSVLEFAKRSITNIKLLYDKHFIVRIEGFNHENFSEDPFANLSPHARFLIPYHLKQLCSHLSAKRSEAKNDALMSEERQLKERLRKMKNHF